MREIFQLRRWCVGHRARSVEVEESLFPLLLRVFLFANACALVLLALRSSPEEPGSLLLPVRGVSRADLADSFRDGRDGGRRAHGAIDIPAPWGTPVLASTEGIIHRLFESERGGLSVHQLDAEARRCYYYGHLSRYAGGLREGNAVARGDVLGYVGATGNAREDNPHLHFAVYDVGTDRSCFTGTPLNPYSLLVAASAD